MGWGRGDLLQLALDLEGEGLEVVRRPGPHRPRRRRRRPAGPGFDLIGEGKQPPARRARLIGFAWCFLSPVVWALLLLSGHIGTVHVRMLQGDRSRPFVARAWPLTWRGGAGDVARTRGRGRDTRHGKRPAMVGDRSTEVVHRCVMVRR